MKKLLRLAAVLLVIAMIVSCTTFKLSGIQVTKEIPSYQTVGEFEIDVRVTEWLGIAGGPNLFNVSSDAMDNKIYDAIQREIQKYTADAAVNITVEYKATFMNLVLNGMTGSIFAPATATVTGVIVKYQ